MALLGRDTSISGPLPKGTLLLETLGGKEVLGQPYQFDLGLLSTDHNISVTKVLGQPLTVSIKLNSGDFRYFHGIVTSFTKAGMSRNHTRYRATLNPTLTQFAYTRDNRVFNDASTVSQTDVDDKAANVGQNALSIVTEVLSHRQPVDLDSDAVKGHTYRNRKYCVQYRESDLNFVQRLLEEEGIYYFFKHEDGKHTMVLADSISAHATVPGYEEIAYFPKERKHQEGEHFWSLEVSGALYPGKYTVLRAYDYTKIRSEKPQFGNAPSADPKPGADFEDYDYPGGLSEESEAKDEATTRARSDHAVNTVIVVEGDTMGLGVGNLVSLKKPVPLEGAINPFWITEDFNKQYLITAATYTISVDQYETGDVTQGDQPFKASYLLLDSQSRYRSQRSADKPRIEGPQTALVVGPAGHEIWTDKLGRVLVQFDWDRLHERNEKSSCWVRVAQVWAGTRWGSIHIPRIGQEVIVEFLDGDPDKPIITGRVYNAENMPPYALPDNKTQSGIKSRSSKGGTASNFNEIRFEDLKGKEELHIQAEKDMNTTVKANQSTTVGGDCSLTVTGNQSVTVKGKGKSPVHSTVGVTGKYSLDASDTIHITAPTSITLECKGSKIEMLPGKITITAGGGAEVVLDGNALMHSKKDSKVVLDDNALMKASGEAEVLLDGNVLAQSKGGSKVVLDGDAMVNGKAKATVKGASEATLTAGGSVKTSPAGVEATGTTVKLNS